MTTLAEMAVPFANELVRKFDSERDVAEMREALTSVRGMFGETYPLVIGGRRVTTAKRIESINPSHPEEVVGSVSSASRKHAALAIASATDAFKSWKRVAVEERAACLFSAAALLRKRRLLFDALLVYEVGKSWHEADADIAEAIDFLEFYAREALRYDLPQPLQPIHGEHNELKYIPLGPGVIIPPWNFALAIMAGMTAAAIVTGNPIALKPSEHSAVVAAWFVDLLQEAGVPADVVNFIPGDAAEIGDFIVTHPEIRFISFTGSKKTGLHINEVAAKPQPRQKWIKRVIAEMGGKNAIIVAEDADLDAAVEGVVASAFGFQGQKCSACSRAIVDASIYEEVLDRLAKRAAEIRVGDPVDPSVYMGPVISEAARNTIARYIESGSREGRLVGGGVLGGESGYYVSPTIIADVDPNARIAQEEIFGPVLAVSKSHGIDDALNIANNTEFGLTGALFTTDQEKIRRVSDEFFVGNLYVNRKSTGAVVGAHPFGGFNMSGTDSKAGGRDYLSLFTQAKVISCAGVSSP